MTAPPSLYIVYNHTRHAHTDSALLARHCRAMFPKYPIWLELEPGKRLEIFDEAQLEFAARIVALHHAPPETETERMERAAAAHMAAPDSESEPDDAQDCTEDWFETVGFKHQHM